ncbi:hypothetical protein SAMN05216503_1603 [Polaribacter sp. KT25b]|uniref:hypothetical protein n=1 Tax=Polaribacter sp. KT25b TaxID=1855336 RepID=UPI00087D1496|nr:hypothetical protein [Polaribacter sp. KT25b]SDR98503.1 hypothetical protein SAMN05216503_1603 [Polaribacter sp. KT25b]
MKKDDKNLYDKDVITGGVTKNVVGEQTIQTHKTKVLKNNEHEVLIGEDIEDVKKVKEEFESLQRKILNKLMK